MKEKLQNASEEVKANAGKIWLAGVGAMAMAGEEGQKLFAGLVEKGEAFEGRDRIPVDAVKQGVGSAKERVEDMVGRFEDVFNDKVGMALQKLGVPTREEISGLTDRVDALMEAINKLNAVYEKDPAPAQPAE